MLKTFPCDRQMDLMDCGPACLKMIAKHYGKYYSLQYLRDKCGTTKEGVSFLDLSHAAETIGLRTLSLKCTTDDLIVKIPLPVIVHWNNSHFIVVYKTSSRMGQIYVSDPAKGLIKYNKKEFEKNWIKNSEKAKGVLMAIEPQSDFTSDRGKNASNEKKPLKIF